MDIARARSPPALSRRPIGPRNPGRPGTLPVKNIIPLDLTARLQEDSPPLPRATSPETISSSSRPESPVSAPAQLSRSTTQSEVNGHQRSDSTSPSTSNIDMVGGRDTDAEVGGASGQTDTEKEKEKEANIAPFTPVPISNPDSSAPDSANSSQDVTSSLSEEAVHAPNDNPSAHQPAAVEMLVVNHAPSLIVPTTPADATEISSPLPAYYSVATGSAVVGSYQPAVPVPPTTPPAIDHAPANIRALPSVPTVPPEQESPPLTPLTDTTNTDSTHVNGSLVVDVKGHERALYSVQASVASPARSSTPGPSTRASTPALLKAIQKRPLIGMPHPLNFDIEPIRWKGLTLEAAQWTFTSEQLQETVSKAIRQSAAESFIRVVPTETYDTELPRELERLESLRLTTQAQYKFNMHRRANLLQLLSVFSQQLDESEGEAMYNVTSQLAELTAACDRLMEALVRISDQKAQIQHVQDLHVSSALAMALRKLNASYAKRSAELKEARARNDELKAELEEAWNMAQDMAQEMDDLDNFDLSFSDDDMTPDDDEPLNSALEAEILDIDRMSAVTSINQARVVEITGKAVATKATLTNVAGIPKSGDRFGRVSAAKKRSSRTSKASLRIPKTPTSRTPTLGNGERPDRMSIHSIRSRLSRSRSLRQAEQVDGAKVGVPIIRYPEPNRSREGSFLELTQTRPTSPAGATTGHFPPLPPKEAFVSTVLPYPMPSRSEETLPAEHGFNPPPSPTFGPIPTIKLPDHSHQQPKSSSWSGRKIFARRVHSMQPSVRSVDDTTPIARPVSSDYKQFDGWPSLFGSTKAQRFSVPVLAAMHPLKGRKSSDSAPAGGSSSS